MSHPYQKRIKQLSDKIYFQMMDLKTLLMEASDGIVAHYDVPNKNGTMLRVVFIELEKIKDNTLTMQYLEKGETTEAGEN